MLDTEAQWSEALVNNNIRAIICWLRLLPAEGDAAVEDLLLTFSCWVQRTSELAKKDLLTLCFSRCQGLWMFLDQNSSTRLHMLLQRMKNLLTLAQWARKHLSSVHLWHGVGVPCVTCRDGSDSADANVTLGCWSRARRALKQHIWLGQLVQWWGIMGLLPKTLDSQQVKLIDQMWKDMKHSQRKAQRQSPKEREAEPGSNGSFIQGMVMELNRQHGCTWCSQACTEQCHYPPPNLQSLLKLVLLPRVDNTSVQAILMYFTLDVVSFLQCKDDLLQAFCHAFTIPQSFSHQIRAFWMFDRGHITTSMQLLLSPRTTTPCLQWQHRCIINKLLMRKEPHVALRYLKCIRPPQETGEDSKLFAQVLLQCSCVSDSWVLLKRSQTPSEDMVTYFFQACEASGLCTEALKYIPAENNNEGDYSRGGATKLYLRCKERHPCPLSASLNQAQTMKPVSSEGLIDLLRKAVMEVRKPHPRRSCMAWPVQTDSKAEGREMLLSTQALRHLTPSPSLIDKGEETQTHEEPQHPVYDDLNLVSIYTISSTSPFPPLKLEHPYMYERTLILQRISSLLADGENHEGENQSTSDSSSSQAELLLTPDSDHPDTSFGLNVQFDVCRNLEMQSTTDILSSDNGNSACRFGGATAVESSIVEIYQKHCDTFGDAALSDCFLDKEQTANEEERSHGFFVEDHPTTTKTHQDVKRNQQSSEASPLTGEQDISSLCSASCSHTHCLSCNIRTSDTASDKPCESFHKVNSEHLTDPNTITWTLEASGGFLSAMEGDVKFKPDIPRPSFPSPSACGLLHLDEFTAEKVEPPGWACLGKVPQQGAIRGGRARLRKGKRLKRV